MSQDLNAEKIDEVSICNLALETCALAAESSFQNVDLVTRSIAYFIEALSIAPKNYKVHLGMGILLLGGKRYNEAIKFINTAKDLNPASEEVEYFFNLAQDALENEMSSKVEGQKTKKKITVDGLLDLSSKFKF